jgi:hypothetical protein
MSTLSQYTFVPRPVNGSMVGASQVQPTGTDGYVYYDVIKGLNSPSGQGDGKRVGFIAYDYVNARWTLQWTVAGQLLVNNGWINDAGAIQDFINGLAAPTTLDQVGDTFPQPASVAPIVAG